MVPAYIGLGSNLGNRCENLLRAWAGLGKVNGVKLLALSSPYRSEPVNMQSTNWFINGVGSLQTSLQPEDLLAEMFAIEASLGRKRSKPDTPEDRSVDLDLLYWGNRISNDPRVTLPHPEIANRLFVLLPLAEIAPDLLHPVNRKTSLEMLQEYMVKQKNNGPGPQVEKTFWPPVNNEASG
jgi:2-amino-4-hydroxy-6-hydroxymethyldihydropteridine diphosphokinase